MTLETIATLGDDGAVAPPAAGKASFARPGRGSRRPAADRTAPCGRNPAGLTEPGIEIQVDETGIDRETMGRLAKALAFICKPEDPAVLALRRAAESGAEGDIKKARTLFLRLKPGDRKAAFAMLSD